MVGLLGRRIAMMVASAAVGVVTSAPLKAQISGRTLANAAEADSVGLRARPGYDATGIPVGGFRLYSSADVGVSYDDNVYNTDADPRSDGILVVKPTVELQSLWSRHSLVLSATGDIQRYDKLTTENNNQYDVSAAGRLDVLSTIALSGNITYGEHTEPRGTLGDVIIGGEPSRYDRLASNVGATIQFVNVVITATGGLEDLNYQPISINDTDVSQNYRDRNAYVGTLRADYAVGPGLRAFVSGAYNVQRYKEKFGDIDQNSDGYAVLAGVNFGLTELLSGEIGVGYLAQTYAQKSFGTVGGFAYNAKLIWNPTTLLTATLTTQRSLQQSPLFDQSGVIQDSLGLNVDYELLRNLIISAAGSGVLNNYRGLDRHDRLYAVDLSARYLINRMLEAGLHFNHRHQSTVGTDGREYSGTSVALSFTLKR